MFNKILNFPIFIAISAEFNGVLLTINDGVLLSNEK